MGKSMKHERKTIIEKNVYTIMFIITLLFSTNLRAGLHEDMLSFEQKYIPTLLLTAQADGQAVAASSKLVTQWNQFKQKQAYRYSDDSLWGFDLVKIERAILDAQRLIQAGDFNRAYNILSTVRIRFASMRERHNIIFYIDGLTRFDSPMQALLKKIRIEQADDVYLEIADAKSAWKNIMLIELNLFNYDLDLQQIEYLQQCLLKGDKLLTSMQEYFLAAEYGKLENLGLQMQELYINTYAVFARN